MGVRRVSEVCFSIYLLFVSATPVSAASISEFDLGARASDSLATARTGDRCASPQLPAECKTTVDGGSSTCALFLEVELRSRRPDPRVRVGSGVASVEQFFQPQVRGRRWVDVTLLGELLSADHPVEVVAERARLERTPECRWLVFESPVVERKRLLLLAPHPDDAEIAAFGLYSSTDADVVTVTAGDAGGFNYRSLVPDPAQHYRLKGRIRTWDSITVPFLGDVMPPRARNLGYYDATLATLWRQRPESVGPPLAALESPGEFRRLNLDPVLRDRPFHSTWESLVADLKDEIMRVQPQYIAAPHPFLDGHPDHQFTTIALVEALSEMSKSTRGEALGEIVLLLYTNHMVGAEPWPFGAKEAVMGFPPMSSDLVDVEFDSLLSLPLSENQVARKILALEMMHDLRPLDLREPKSLGEEWREAFAALGRSARRFRPTDYRYLRRAPRPNELFFVLDVQQALSMRERFLRTR